MKAARVLQFGPPNVIITDDLPRPEPGAGQLLVRVKAAGVGNWDALVRGGKIPNEHLPLILVTSYPASLKQPEQELPGLRLAKKYTGLQTSNSRSIRRICVAFGQNDGTKTEDSELHRGRLGAGCDRNSLADAIRLCPRERRAGNSDPRRRWQCGRLRRATSQTSWPPCGCDRRLCRCGLRPRSAC